MVPQDLSPSRGAATRTTESWDPYDVWLKRVKLPRERQPARLVAVATRAEAAATAHGADERPVGSLLLPGVR